METETTIRATQTQESQTEKTRPTYKVNRNGIQIAAWKHTNKDGQIYFSYTLQRSYKDADGNWQQTQSLRTSDLLVAGTLLQQAWVDEVNE